MKTTISRDPHEGGQGRSGVYQQQGRMFTDTDWNAWVAEFGAAIGMVREDLAPAGSPRTGGVLQPSEGGPRLVWGQILAEGEQAMLAPQEGSGGALFDYQRQADLPAPPPPPADRPVTLYLDLWENPITVLGDPELADPGLGGGDTCTRTRTMAQVKWCELALDPEGQLPPLGDAHLALTLRGLALGADPCDPCAAELPLDEEVGDYLFRVEVHGIETDEAGVPIELVFKWSRENGAVQRAYDDPGTEISGEGWVYEWFDQDTERLAGIHPAPGYRPLLGRLGDSPARPEAPPNRWLRRWDGYCVLARREGDGWRLVEGRDLDVALSEGRDRSSHGRVAVTASVVTLELEQLTLRLGDSVHPFAESRFVAGDYWLAPVRDALHAPDAPVLGDDTQGVPPVGIRHRYLRLGRLEAGALILDALARRRLGFPSLSDLRARDLTLDDPRPPLLANLDNAQQALDLLGGIGGGLAADQVTHSVPGCPRPDPVRSLLGLEPGAANVASVLDELLCRLRAQQLPIAKTQGLCGTLARFEVRSVQDALARLCVQGGRRDCAVSVGLGGDHATLTEALTALEDAPDLDLALLPGTHTLDDVQLEGRERLRLAGAGSEASLLQVAGRSSLDAVELELEGLGLTLAESAEALELRGRAVRARGCAFEQALGPERQSWLRRYGGRSRGKAMAVDADGSLYLGADDVSSAGVVLKLRADGVLQWIREGLGQRVYALAVDEAGNLLVHGTCTAGTDLGDGVPVENNGDFLLKLDPDGGYLWSKAFGGGTGSFGGMATDAAGNVLAAGGFEDDADFGDGPVRSPGGTTGIYVLKLDPDGGHLWSLPIGTTRLADEAYALAIDQLGNVLVCGRLGGSLSFGGPTLRNGKFVLKLSPDGEHLWSRDFDGGGEAHAIAVDGLGNVVVSGIITREMKFGDRRIGDPFTTNDRPFVLQLDADGHNLWANAYEPSELGSRCFGAGVDGAGQVWIAGHFKGEVDLGGGPMVSETSASNGLQMFVLALSSEGEYRQSHTFPGLGGAFGLDVAVRGSLAGNVLVSGDMKEPVTIGGRTLEHAGGGAAFFLHLAGLDASAPLVRVSPPEQVGEQEAVLHWSGNRMGARLQEIPEAEDVAGISFLQAPPPLLALAGHRVGGWVRDNRIAGSLRLMDGKPRSLEVGDDPAILPPLTPGSSLHLEGNSLHRLVCMHDPAAEATEAPAALSLRGNGFADAGSSFIAGSLSLQGNRFAGGSGTAPVVAVARSGTGVYTGNQARNAGAVLRRHQEISGADAANLLSLEDN